MHLHLSVTMETQPVHKKVACKPHTPNCTQQHETRNHTVNDSAHMTPQPRGTSSSFSCTVFGQVITGIVCFMSGLLI